MQPTNPADNEADSFSLPNTYTNRVAKFEAEQKATKAPKTKKVDGKVISDVTFREAHTTAFKALPRWKQTEVLNWEATGNTDHRHYDEFLAQVIIAAGELPSLALRNRIKGI